MNPWVRGIVTALVFALLGGLATRGVPFVGTDWTAGGVPLPVLGPAMALAVVAVGLWGAPMAFAVAVGATGVAALLPLSVAARAALVVGCALGALVAGGLLAWVRLRPSFPRVRDVYAFLVAGGLLAPAVVGLGIMAIAAYGTTFGARAAAGAQVMAETAVGVVVVAPVLFAALSAWGRRRPTRFDTGKTARDRVVVVLVVAAMSYAAFGPLLPVDLRSVAALVLFPFLAVAATRMALGTLTVAVLIVGLGAMGTTFVDGTFLAAREGMSAFWLAEAYAAGVAVTALLVHGIVRERHGVQASLGEAQEQYKRLLDYAPDLIVSIDRKARVLFTNRSLGTHSPAEARGRSFLEMFEGEAETVMRDRLALVFNTGKRTKCEVPGKGARGRATWYACELGPVRGETGIIAAMVILRDVTDRRIAEEQLRDREARLRALFEGSTLAIAVVGRDGRVQEVNPAFGALVGEDPALCTDEPWLRFVDEQDRAAEEPLLEELLVGRRDSYQLEEQFIGPGDRTPWVRLTMSLVRNHEGEPLFAVAMAEDIKARLEAEEADRVASDRLREIERLEEVSEWKTQLLNIASHEIKNPLVPIRIQLSLLRKGKYGTLNDDQVNAVGIVERESERLATLVNDVLDMARVQVGRLRVDPEPTAADAMLDASVEGFQAAAEESGVTLVRTGGEGQRVMADEARVRQVLVNFLSNALKFTPEGGRVEVGAEPRDGFVRITVTDTGPGMTEEQIGRLFQPFSQVHDTKTGPAGTGIGLFIARGIVEAHGGEIGVRSPGPGKGSTFWFTLPSA